MFTCRCFFTKGVNGWMPKRIAFDIIWNSTANLNGLPGTNIALDLVNEFLNNEFKSKSIIHIDFFKGFIIFLV